jgi:hypothetical protein
MIEKIAKKQSEKFISNPFLSSPLLPTNSNSVPMATNSSLTTHDINLLFLLLEEPEKQQQLKEKSLRSASFIQHSTMTELNEQHQKILIPRAPLCNQTSLEVPVTSLLYKQGRRDEQGNKKKEQEQAASKTKSPPPKIENSGYLPIRTDENMCYEEQNLQDSSSSSSDNKRRRRSTSPDSSTRKSTSSTIAECTTKTDIPLDSFARVHYRKDFQYSSGQGDRTDAEEGIGELVKKRQRLTTNQDAKDGAFPIISAIDDNINSSSEKAIDPDTGARTVHDNSAEKNDVKTKEDEIVASPPAEQQSYQTQAIDEIDSWQAFMDKQQQQEDDDETEQAVDSSSSKRMIQQKVVRMAVAPSATTMAIAEAEEVHPSKSYGRSWQQEETNKNKHATAPSNKTENVYCSPYYQDEPQYDHQLRGTKSSSSTVSSYQTRFEESNHLSHPRHDISNTPAGFYFHNNSSSEATSNQHTSHHPAISTSSYHKSSSTAASNGSRQPEILAPASITTYAAAEDNSIDGLLPPRGGNSDNISYPAGGRHHQQQHRHDDNKHHPANMVARSNRVHEHPHHIGGRPFLAHRASASASHLPRRPRSSSSAIAPVNRGGYDNTIASTSHRSRSASYPPVPPLNEPHCLTETGEILYGDSFYSSNATAGADPHSPVGLVDGRFTSSLEIARQRGHHHDASARSHHTHHSTYPSQYQQQIVDHQQYYNARSYDAQASNSQQQHPARKGARNIASESPSFMSSSSFNQHNNHHSQSSASMPTMLSDAAPLQPYYNRPVLALSTDDDENWLSEFLCFVRSQCVEVFSASQDDVASRMNSKKVLLGQVGIRCRFCAHLPHRERTGRSSSFPSSINRIYQSLTMMLRDHFTKCSAMPPQMNERYLCLKANASQGATDSKKYWIESAHSLGLVDTDEKGIRFQQEQEEKQGDDTYISGIGADDEEDGGS